MSTTVTTEIPIKEQEPIAARDATVVLRGPKSHYDVTLNYRLDPLEGGNEIIWGGTVGQLRRKYKTAEVRISDARGHEDEFSLDTHGFAWVKHATEVTDFSDFMTVRNGPYYGETAEMVKKVTGATHVEVFSHLARALNFEATCEDDKDTPDMAMTKGFTPARFVHIDQSYNGAYGRMYKDLGPEKAAKYFKHKWAIINLWRPLVQITNDPLAVCDARSVKDEELVDTMHLVPVRWPDVIPQENRMWEVKPPADKNQHKWHYLSGQQPDEALLIKIFDSRDDGRARRVPHTSFATPDDYGVPRSSVEARCYVIWEDEAAKEEST